MSYRAFKRLLGETSLERKCRFLFGIGILLLISISFWLYAAQTEHLAYDQAVTSCRMLVHPVLAQHHLQFLKGDDVRDEGSKLFKALEQATVDMSGKQQHYQYSILHENYSSLDDWERHRLREFASGKSDREEDFRLRANKQYDYYVPLRATQNCIDCHQKVAARKELPIPTANAYLGTLRISVPTLAIEEGVHWNRALLMATALGTAILIMTGSWLIVRYIIVKPVTHLKEVSDAISAGQLNVRSEIQTGDEFEDLSHAFNRMLRNLVNMQDQWRKVSTDLDRKVDELAQANMALYESNRLKSDFLATMSHELRTPLNSILGFSDVLSSGDQLNEKQLRWVRNIRTSGERLLNLINDILDLAKIEAGKMRLRVEDFNLTDVCEGLINMFRPLAEKKNIDLRSQIAPGIPPLRQDMTKLQQIFQNLLSNAIKFTPEGGRVTLKAEADRDHFVVTITDTGVGIAAEEQESIFEKFRQSGNPLTREHAGTGLGLSIVRELSKLLGGEVVVQSELGRGSVFTVRLPLQLGAEQRLEFDLADERVDLSKAQRIDVRLLSPGTTRTILDRPTETKLDISGDAERGPEKSP